MILAAVTINAAFNSGIIDIAVNGVEKYTIAQKKEMDEFNSIKNYLGDNLNRIYGEGGGSEGENPPPVIITGTVEFGGLRWTSGKASVTITKTISDDYKIEYKVTNSTGTITTNYTEIANGETVGNLNLGDVVTARLTDGTNHGDSASITVADKKEPTAGITVGTVTRDSITVTATGTDAESGVKDYTFEYKVSTASAYTGTTTKTTTSHTFTGLTVGQTYNFKVTVTDNAGNTKEATTTGVPFPEGWDEEKVDPVKSADNIDVPVPKGFVASKATGENTVKDGFVIYQGMEDVTDSNVGTAMTTRNQFVWVPVKDISSMFWKNSEGKDVGQLYNFDITNKTYSKITTWDTSSSDSFREPDVVTTYDNNANNYSNAGIAGITNADQFKIQLETEFAEMKASIERYHGFYIGRYETGGVSTGKAVTVKGNSDVANQTWYKHYQMNKDMIKENGIKSSMIWGSQWDQTMIWFDTQGGAKKDYVYNSTGKGYYHQYNSGTTGLSTYYAVNTIYDMAGNVWEWTLVANRTDLRTSRGRR